MYEANTRSYTEKAMRKNTLINMIALPVRIVIIYLKPF